MRPRSISRVMFVALAAIAVACATPLPTAKCKNPAPIEGKWDAAAPGYIVAMRKDKDLQTVAARLARKYHLKLLLLRTIHAFIFPVLNDEVLLRLA
jgi:hypothetical protein